MTKYERQNAEEMRDKLKKILPDLKLAYEYDERKDNRKDDENE